VREEQESLLDLVPVRTHPDGSTHPIFIVLAYRTDISPQKIYQKFLAHDQQDRPDLLCVLEHGILGCSGASLDGVADRDFKIGLTLLHNDGDSSEDRHHRVEKDHAARTVTIRERLYPIVEYNQVHFACDPARALLLFVEALLRRLAEQSNRRPLCLRTILMPELVN
jgi:hypothetical protein